MKRESDIPFRVFKRSHDDHRAIVLLGAVLACGLSAKALPAALQSKDAAKSGGTVYLHETFEEFDVNSVPKIPQLQRVDMVTVVDGSGKVGDGKVARFEDSDDSKGGAMEYNVGESELGSMYIEFDARNNSPEIGGKSSTVIFGVGPWGMGKSLMLNSKSKRAFGFEMYQQEISQVADRRRYRRAIQIRCCISVQHQDLGKRPRRKYSLI